MEGIIKSIDLRRAEVKLQS